MNEMSVREFLIGVLTYGLLNGGAHAGDVPAIRAGLWSTTTTLGDPALPRMTGTMCTSTALLQALFDSQYKGAHPPCKRTGVVQSGATTVEHQECQFGNDKPVKSTVTTVVAGDTSVHSEVRREGNVATIVSDSKYMSSCPAGMRLGDYVGSDGRNFNVLHPADPKVPAKTP
jgi:hypothetical protein